jgi:hypothetical protein
MYALGSLGVCGIKFWNELFRVITSYDTFLRQRKMLNIIFGVPLLKTRLKK